MSDESILILNMLREGKITADQADSLLKAVRPAVASAPTPPPAPAPPPAPTADPVALAQMQGKLSELQGKLGDLQGKLGAAQAARAAGQAASLLGKAFEHMPKPDFDYTKIVSKSVDEALRGLSSLKSDALRTAKVAARQAGQEARRAAREGRRAVDDIASYWTATADENDGRPANTGAKPEARETTDTVAAWDGASSLMITNSYGNAAITGRDDTVSEARGTVTKTAWAETEAEARVLLQQVFLTNRIEGGKCYLEIVAPADARGRLTVDITLSVPRGMALEVETTHGDLTIEETSAQTKARAGSGKLIARRLYEQAGGDGLFQTRSGALRLEDCSAPQTVWTMQTTSGGLSGDGVSCRSLTCASRSGDIELRCIQTAGDATAENISGDCDLADGSIGGRLQVKTQSGSIQSADLRASQIVLETVSGDICVRSLAGTLTLKTVSGDIQGETLSSAAAAVGTVSGDAHLVFDGPFSGSLAASSVSGDLHVSLAAASDTRLEMGTTTGDLHCRIALSQTSVSSKQVISGMLGAGAGNLKLQSVSGDLILDERH